MSENNPTPNPEPTPTPAPVPTPAPAPEPAPAPAPEPTPVDSELAPLTDEQLATMSTEEITAHAEKLEAQVKAAKRQTPDQIRENQVQRLRNAQEKALGQTNADAETQLRTTQEAVNQARANGEVPTDPKVKKAMVDENINSMSALK